MIDGFDPDKFRQVNRRGGGGGGVTGVGASTTSDYSLPPPVSQFGSITSNVGTSATLNEDMMPGSVPTYDSTEKQMLASLERELGVI